MHLTPVFIILSVLISVFVLGCQTPVKNPGKTRGENPLSIGSGILFTPKKEVGFAATFDVESLRQSETSKIRPGGRGSNAYTINLDAMDRDLRTIKSSGIGFDMLSLYFPWDRSSIFVGALGRLKQKRNAYNEWVADFSLSGKTTNVEWEDQSLNIGAIIGFDERFENRSAFTTGVAFGRRVMNRRRFLDDGNSDQVDRQIRDQTMMSFDEYQKRMRAMFVFMWTYSMR